MAGPRLLPEDLGQGLGAGGGWPGVCFPKFSASSMAQVATWHPALERPWPDGGTILGTRRENTLNQAHRAIMGWLAHVSDGETSGLPLACGWCGALTRHACPYYHQGLCIHCDRDCPTIVTGTAPHGCAATSSMQQVEGGSPSQRFNLASLVVLFLASCMGQRYCHRRRGVGSVRCAGDGGEDLQPGWQAVDAMQRIETQRVQEWRKIHGLRVTRTSPLPS